MAPLAHLIWALTLSPTVAYTPALLLHRAAQCSHGELPVHAFQVVTAHAPTRSLERAHCRMSSTSDATVRELSISQIAEMVETSFVSACMDAARGYIDTMKLFIVAVKAAFERGVSFERLAQALSGCERQTAGRPLMAEEEELRKVWACLVYLTLEETDHHPHYHAAPASPGQTVPAEQRERFADFVTNVVDARAKGITLPSLQLESVWRGDEPRNAVETAVLSQSMRVVFLTITVLKEEALASGKEPPKPFIPGVDN
uniref:Uncharacterized protein n=1 Tax=Coccolithus braarudii TaxID=221442 RepID=A0A7S0L487_9EUKA|mmetsp:Transcript_19455/g.41947  ORF Transcript_19455/g.41947 Transcript_19455/m.41947 type:complete len:258 (+) Transcript_19455:12-785(+)